MKIQRTSRIFVLALPLLAGAAVSASAQPRYNNGGKFDSRDDARRGTVARIYSNSEFDLRTSNGSILRVKTDSYLNLRRGDFVSLRGDLRGNTFYAQSVNRRDDDFPGNQGRERDIAFRGEVVEVEGTQQLRVRDSQGRIYLVRTLDRIGRRISRGDQVSVRGLFDGSFVRADNDSVVLLNDDNVYDGYNPRGSRVNFPAIIRYVNNRQLVVRGDNGRTYTVLASNINLGGLRPGDRVRVEGVVGTDVIQASRVSYLR